MGLVYVTGLQKDALHIYAGVSIYLLGLLLFRRLGRRFRTHSGVLALLLTTTIAILAEVLDLQYIGSALGQHQALPSPKALAASVHDIINTCLLPYTLYALSRWTRLLQPQR